MVNVISEKNHSLSRGEDFVVVVSVISEKQSLSPLEGERQPKLRQAILAERGGYDVEFAKERLKGPSTPLPNFNSERIEIIPLPQGARVLL